MIEQRPVPMPDNLAGPGQDRNPELAETLYQALLEWVELGSEELDSELRKLEQVHQDAVYSELIFLLSHLRFDSSEAKRYWREIVDHRDSMQRRLDGFVDLRVAFVSYFLQVNRKLQNPKIIELRLFERTRAFAYRDELTGLYNYRFFGEFLAQEIQRAGRYNTPLSLVMVDVDNFKHYNDRQGHEAGNAVLAAVARLLTESLRKEDLPARYGGEEFALILPSTPKLGAQLVAQRTRASIERHAFPFEGEQPLGKLTVSMGVATCPGDATEPSDLVRCADRALYAAKAGGRNQVQLYARSSRSFHRIRVPLEGQFRTLVGDPCPLTTIDISEGGLLFLSQKSLPSGSLVEIHLRLPEDKGEVSVSGRLVHAQARKDGAVEAAVRIVDMETQDRLLLSRFVAELRQRADGDGEGGNGDEGG